MPWRFPHKLTFRPTLFDLRNHSIDELIIQQHPTSNMISSAAGEFTALVRLQDARRTLFGENVDFIKSGKN
jgi:hypothetical protein